MLLDFNMMPEATIPGMNGGTGTMTARMHMGAQGKLIRRAIHAGGSR